MSALDDDLDIDISDVEEGEYEVSSEGRFTVF